MVLYLSLLVTSCIDGQGDGRSVTTPHSACDVAETLPHRNANVIEETYVCEVTDSLPPRTMTPHTSTAVSISHVAGCLSPRM